MNNKLNCIIVDLDNCLINSTKRHENYTKSDGKLDFDNLHNGILKFDLFDKVMREMVMSIDKNLIDKVFFLSGRNEKARKNTMKHLRFDYEFNYTILECNNFLKHELILRSIDDYRTSFDYKIEHLQKIKEEYNIVWYADDDLSCIMAAKDLNIKAIWYEANSSCSYAHDNFKKYIDKKTLEFLSI